MKKILLIIIFIVSSFILSSCFSNVFLTKNVPQIVDFDKLMKKNVRRNENNTAKYVVTVLDITDTEIKIHFRSLYKNKIGIFAFRENNVYIDDKKQETFYFYRNGRSKGRLAPFSYSVKSDDFILTIKTFDYYNKNRVRLLLFHENYSDVYTEKGELIPNKSIKDLPIFSIT